MSGTFSLRRNAKRAGTAPGNTNGQGGAADPVLGYKELSVLLSEGPTALDWAKTRKMQPIKQALATKYITPRICWFY